MTEWTDDRLADLYARYARKYWPGSRQIAKYLIRAGSLDAAFGRCDLEARVITIDVAAHRCDSDVRSTVLHEMCHAAAGRPGHHSPFWEQLEHLLAESAPITVGFPETGEFGLMGTVSPDSIPERFPLCRRKFERDYQRHVEAIVKRFGNSGRTFRPADFETECYDAAALEGQLWRDIWRVYSVQHGFVDLDNRVKPWAVAYREAGLKGARRGRRFYIEDLAARKTMGLG